MAAPEFDAREVFGSGQPRAKKQPNTKASKSVRTPGGSQDVGADTVAQFSQRGTKRQAKNEAIEEEIFPILGELLEEGQRIAAQDYEPLPGNKKELKQLVPRVIRKQIMRSRALNPFWDRQQEDKFNQRKFKRLTEISQEIRGLVGVVQDLDPTGKAAVDAMISDRRTMLEIQAVTQQVQAWAQGFQGRHGRAPNTSEMLTAERKFSGMDSPAKAMKERADAIGALGKVAPGLSEEEFGNPIYDPYRGSMTQARNKYERENANKPLKEFMTPDNLNGLYTDQFSGHLESLRRFTPLLGSVREAGGEDNPFADIFGGKPGGLSLSMRALPATDRMRRRAKVKALWSVRELVNKQKGQFEVALQRLNVVTDDRLMEELQGYSESTPKEREMQDSILLQQEADAFNQVLTDQRDAMFGDDNAANPQ